LTQSTGAWLAVTGSSDDQYVDRLWRGVLRREVETDARADALARLEAGMSRSALLHELVTSAEFRHVRVLDDAVAFATAARRAGARPRNLTAPPGTDERPIEIPWVLSRYAGEARVLDAGYAFAEPAYLAGLTGLGAAVTGVDLVTVDVPGITSVQADLRRLPFPRGSFDLAIAISTLEHIGRDNSQYGLAAEDDGAALGAALGGIRKALSRNGRLLVTVPTGAGERLPEQIVLEPAAWIKRFEAAGFLVWEDELYELRDEGWRSVSTLTPGLQYGERGPGASAVLCAELRPRGLTARVRLAVRDRRYPDDPRRAT
jgi:Methyltransferase domain